MSKTNFTTNHLYITTKNRQKYESISRSISLLNKKIFLHDILDTNIPECEENGINSKQNSLIKAKYYYEFLKENILSEDDAIYFSGLENQYQPKHLAKRAGEENSNENNYWLEFITKNKIKTGVLEKNFTLITKPGSIFSTKIKIPFTIKLPRRLAVNINALNNFMIPKNFQITFIKMSLADKNQFSKKYICPKLNKLLTNLK